jgi:hypothetical protein
LPSAINSIVAMPVTGLVSECHPPDSVLIDLGWTVEIERPAHDVGRRRSTLADRDDGAGELLLSDPTVDDSLDGGDTRLRDYRECGYRQHARHTDGTRTTQQ